MRVAPILALARGSSRSVGADMMPLAARRRTMQTAELVDTHSVREAAIVGGIVRCIIANGCCEVEFIARYAREIIGAFNLVGVDRSTPGDAEVRMVLDRFRDVRTQMSED